jgi:hypothetical protein
LGDWEIVLRMHVPKRGEVERKTLQQLSDYFSPREYVKDKKPQLAREIVKCSFSVAINAILKSVGDGERKDVVRSTEWRRYDFV